MKYSSDLAKPEALKPQLEQNLEMRAPLVIEHQDIPGAESAFMSLEEFKKG